VDREVVHDRHVLQAVVVKHRQLREIEVRRRGPTFLRNDFLFLNRGSSLIVRIRKFSFFFFVTLVQFIYGTSRDMERQWDSCVFIYNVDIPCIQVKLCKIHSRNQAHFDRHRLLPTSDQSRSPQMHSRTHRHRQNGLLETVRPRRHPSSSLSDTVWSIRDLLREAEIE
jgi:hypothetical protein